MTVETISHPEASELGKKSNYQSTYNPNKLFPIARKKNRENLGITATSLPFYGFDYWNHYEVSWLNNKGKPEVAIAEIIYACDSPYIIESKSMKLYFNSFNNSHFADVHALQAIIQQDLTERLGSSAVTVNIVPLHALATEPKLAGICLDQLDIECSVYTITPSFLATETETVTETLYSDLLKSNCLVTQQPDWCSVQISYTGKKINHAGLLRYIVSFRNENEFHEHCIEKIFMHILQRCQPEELTIVGRSTRRGGIDINSVRSTKPLTQGMISNKKIYRQ